jgi:hypothetical protein
MEQYNSESDKSAPEKGKRQPDSGSLVACWVVNPKDLKLPDFDPFGNE